MTNQLAFHNTQFNVITRSNQVWLTSAEIAQALCYKCTDAVTKIYNRNSDEFGADMTLTVKLGVKGFGNGASEKEVRVFSLRGAHLIAMFARTPVAKEFRRWVLDVLDREVKEPTFLPAPAKPQEYAVGGPHVIVTHFDETGRIRDSYPLPEDSVMCTIDIFRHYMERDGWLVVRKEELVERLLTFK